MYMDMTIREICTLTVYLAMLRIILTIFRYDKALTYIKEFLHFKDIEWYIYGWNNMMLGAFSNVFQWQQQDIYLTTYIYG